VAPVAAGTMLAEQQAGDCKVQVCDGQGKAIPQDDDGDVKDDGNDCTTDICSGGVSSSVAGLAGVPCDQGSKVCNDKGACVECLFGIECGSGVCSNGVCQAPSCTDGVKNGDESDVDCGSLCGFCAAGQKCSGGDDCVSGFCGEGVCKPFVAAVGGGQDFSCVLRGDGAVKCWGRNLNGSLGLGDLVARGDNAGEMGNNLPTVDLGTGRTAKAISRAQGSHVCAILDDGSVKCWGRNDLGQLGLGDTANRGDNAGEMGDKLPTVDLGTGRTAKALSLGQTHSCALLDDDSVKCWGDNGQGRLGQGDTNHRGDGADEMGDALPSIDLGTNRKAKAIAVGGTQTCAILDDDTAKCWGMGSQGRLLNGNGNHLGDAPGEMGDNLPPINAGVDRKIVSFGMADSHTCILLDNGVVKCAGYGLDGRLGYGDKVHHGIPEVGDALPTIDLGTGRTAKRFIVGGNHHCALLDDDTIKCWGLNGGGQLGLGDTATRGDELTDMGDLLPTLDLGTGLVLRDWIANNSHTCVIFTSDQLKCWGNNNTGTLGLGHSNNRGDAPGEMGDALPFVSF
jgi:alpha-tubulin suppressor-like RCC1 family protein